ncbi:MAG: two component response regulator [Candidatus Scalindua rubra]|uniref:Two component response regulator n=1 Tax=Candidatus Scalindua rubra TaxID=1872076 RepID=A0A1E3XBV5_9BACT|nr:MAG: two component response regulator [Candidatus Scalindua rubra]
MKTVLVVENNKNQALLYEQEFKFEGYNVILARNGREAIEKIDEQIPDIMITEITMPIMDSIKVINMSRKLFKLSKIPIIINTAYGDYKDNFMTMIADACIIKSSDLSELKNKAKELLGKNA